MSVTVKFMGALRHLSGQKQLTLPYMVDCSIKDYLLKISQDMPQVKSSLLDANVEDPKPNALMLINGKEISVLKGLATKIQPNDEIILIPVVHGG